DGKSARDRAGTRGTERVNDRALGWSDHGGRAAGRYDLARCCEVDFGDQSASIRARRGDCGESKGTHSGRGNGDGQDPSDRELHATGELRFNQYEYRPGRWVSSALGNAGVSEALRRLQGQGESHTVDAEGNWNRVISSDDLLGRPVT